MKEQGCGELDAPLQLGRQAGRPATVLPFPLFCFGNFMKKKGEAEQLGRDSWRASLFRHVAADKLGRRKMRAGGNGWRERE